MPQNLTNEWTLFQVIAWYRQWKNITWANLDPDLCPHMASLRHNELISCESDIFLLKYYFR